MAREERLTEADVRGETPMHSRRRQSASREPEEPSQARSEGRDTMDAQDITDDERFAMFTDTINQSVLPKVPDDPEYHFCWISTTHQSDTVQTRQRMGYELVTYDMVPGWHGAHLKSADFPGVVTVKEMVLGRIPARLYQRYMAELHHHRPLSEEEGLRAALNAAKEKAVDDGGQLIEGDGMPDLVKRAEVPRFAV